VPKLIRAWIFNEGTGGTIFEYVNRSVDTIVGAEWATGQGGFGLDIQSGDYIECRDAPASEVGVCDQSQFMIVDLDTLTGSHESFYYGTNWLANQTYWGTYWSGSASFNLQNTVTQRYYANLLSTGLHSYAFRIPVSDTGRSWRDGAYVSVLDGTFTQDNGGTYDDVTIGNFYNADYNEPLQGRMFCLYWFRGYLTDADVALLHREPYAMFQQERRVSILTPLYRFWPDDAKSLWYSKGNYSTLPTGDEDYEDDFQGKDYENVEFEDGVFVLQTANGETAGFRFNSQNTNNTDPISVSADSVKSTLAPSSSTVYLQIYNRNTPAWETLDSESTVGANVLFDLSGVQSSNLSYYYDSDNVVRFRVWQEVV
jgi:hypothetical protein